MVVAAGEQAAVVDDVLGVVVAAVVRVDLPSAPLQSRMSFVVVGQILIDGGYGCDADDEDEIGFVESVE